MEKYKEGTVFAMSEENKQEYIILKNVIFDDEVYLVVSPTIGDINNLKFDAKGLMLLKVNEQTDEISFIKNEDIISKVLDKIFVG